MVVGEVECVYKGVGASACRFRVQLEDSGTDVVTVVLQWCGVHHLLFTGLVMVADVLAKVLSMRFEKVSGEGLCVDVGNVDNGVDGSQLGASVLHVFTYLGNLNGEMEHAPVCVLILTNDNGCAVIDVDGCGHNRKDVQLSEHVLNAGDCTGGGGGGLDLRRR